jgi:hypothetical protein
VLIADGSPGAVELIPSITVLCRVHGYSRATVGKASRT